MADHYKDSLIKNLKYLLDEFEKEELAVRQRQLRLWKKLDYYWNGFQRIWWSEVNHDWRVFDNEVLQNSNEDMAFYDKPINVFKAYLESIIAALSVTVPPVKGIPDNADDALDCLTAKGATKIGELVYKHNDAPLLWLQALYIFCTQGMIAAYNYSDTDEKYGTVTIPKKETKEEDSEYQVCPICKQRLADKAANIKEKNEYDPDDMDAFVQDMILNENQMFCSNCLVQVDPEIAYEKLVVTRIVGETQEPKTRQCIKVLGGLNVKVPNYAICQEEVPALGYCYETHFTNVLKEWPDLRNSYGEISTSNSGNDQYERWARLSTQYTGEFPQNTPTVKNWWFRPSTFEMIADENERKELYKKFPNGAKVVFVNDTFAEACNENLDDHWTLSKNPLSRFVHYDPLGTLLTSIQEITNDLISLTLQTIEHGVSMTFADPAIVNFKQFEQTEVAPGNMYPTKSPSGKSIGDGFYETSTATLSKEVGPFGEQIQSLGQFTSGAVPSIYGGEQSSGSKTAAEYSMSRSQSLQRLQTTWKVLQYWWKGVFGKVVPAYIKTMLEDERWSKEQQGNFVSVVVKRAEMEGKLGSIELNVSEQLPLTWEQRKDIIMNLMNQANPAIMQAIASPENAHLLAEALGLDDLEVPGEDDRQKQFEEIKLLLESQPMDNGQGGEVTSIEPDMYVDNHSVEMDICRYYLVSEAGRQAKANNPQGYKNILLHMQAHFQMKMQVQQMMNPHPMDVNQPPPQQPGKGPKIQKPAGQGNTNVPGAQIH